MQRLYDANMQLLGYVQSGARGTRQTAYDSDFRVLGYYYPISDKTYDKDLRLIGKGNLLVSLLGAPTPTGG